MLEDTASAHFLARWGYLAVLVGTMLEGETVVLVAGFLAHQGYLSLPWIVIFAIIGSSISDQGLFFLSRLKGVKFLSRFFPKALDKTKALSDKMRGRAGTLTAFALFFRFLYGLRNIAPVFLGMSSIPTLHFVILNAVGAILWAISFSLVGYIFAKTLEAIMGTLARFEILFVILLITGGVAWALYRRYRHAAPLSAEPQKDKTSERTGTDT